MKERFVKNSIDILYDAQDIKLTQTIDIQNEVMSFYKKLLGSATTNLPRVLDITVVRVGQQMSHQAVIELTGLVLC